MAMIVLNTLPRRGAEPWHEVTEGEGNWSEKETCMQRGSSSGKPLRSGLGSYYGPKGRALK